MNLLNRPEREIKKEIIKYLRLRGHLVIPYRTIGIRKKEGGFIPAPMLGVSDLLGLTKDGKFFAIEVKRKGEGPSIPQKAFLQAVKQFNGIAITASSIDEVMASGL